MNFEKVSEFPDREEQLKHLQEKSKKLEEGLERFNLPDNLSFDNQSWPEYLSDHDRSEILRIWKALEEIKIRRQFLENPDEFKK